ncbi:DUF4279 domain-containing protein [Hymenobacter gummosus]|uniref:DUF4279 domain-containing protein n=1 Tax=Hymenobacter gummosus TaxID=1776032 RepID=A0A431TXF5_9BACT|nr:DUF4279 domain-containing protein [Hymenobacter gummosus]RTQ46307.1 DUF4279 domain-containing protein [Hymenobacter gummosus]
MPAAHSYVYFALQGHDFDPAEVTRRLGTEPTAAWRRGDKLRYNPSAKYACWQWQTRPAALLLDELVTQVVARFEDHAPAIVGLKQQFGLDSVLEIVLYVDVNDEAPAPALGHDLRTISFLYRTQTTTDVDIYRYDSREEE